MITPAIVEEIGRLLGEERLSRRKIAVRTGVSRGTVNAIALGKRPDYAPRKGQWADDFVPPGGLPLRCPGCGGMVQMPCLACRVRAVKEGKSTSDEAASQTACASCGGSQPLIRH